MKIELQKLYYNCYAKKEAHYKSSIYCQHMDKCISAPLIILSSVLSTSTFSQASSSDNAKTNNSLNWFIAGSSMTLTILTALNKYFDYSSRKENNKRASLQYGKLARYIKLHLDEQCDEKNLIDTYKYATEEYSKISETSPLISTWSKNDNYEGVLKRVIEQDTKLEEIIINNN